MHSTAGKFSKSLICLIILTPVPSYPNRAAFQTNGNSMMLFSKEWFNSSKYA
jgi:hypothetical protein